jgi:hypothetical protein
VPRFHFTIASAERSKSGAAAEAGLQDAEQAEEGRERHPYQLEEAPLPQDDGGFFGAFGALDLGPYGAVPLAEAPRGYQAREDGEETEEEEDWGEGGGNAFRRRMQRERERQAAAAGQSGSEDELDVETERWAGGKRSGMLRQLGTCWRCHFAC